MIDLHILVPVADNSGNLFDEPLRHRFEEALMDLFGGFTGPSLPVGGGWKDEAGLAYRDLNRTYTVFVPGLIGSAPQIQAVVLYAKSITARRQLQSGTSITRKSSNYRPDQPTGISHSYSDQERSVATYECLSGALIDYPEPPPDVAAFLDRAKSATTDPLVDLVGMNQLIFGERNPLLDRSTGRAMVTRAVFENPLYRVLNDLLDVKAVNLGLLDLNAAAAAYTVTVIEAADRLGITPASVRAAIVSGKLAARKRNGEWYLRPEAVSSYKVSNRGRKHERKEIQA